MSIRVKKRVWVDGIGGGVPGWSLVSLFRSRGIRGRWGLLLIAPLIVGCDVDVPIGIKTCKSPDSGTTMGGVGGGSAGAALADVPWSTGFEDGFCSYQLPGGFCYTKGSGSFELVQSPVHSGRFAAAFHLVANAGLASGEARCVRQGIFPKSAYYGAWYFVPETAKNTGNWNLLHFQGVTGSSVKEHGIWDISLTNDATGALRLWVYDFLNFRAPSTATLPPVPIGAWFHIEIYLDRAADKTGAVTVYQDGQVAVSLTNTITDDTTWSQFYVGNLATGLTPAETTVYVDDVTIRGQ